MTRFLAKPSVTFTPWSGKNAAFLTFTFCMGMPLGIQGLNYPVCRALHTAHHRGLLLLSCCSSCEVDADDSELYQVIDHVSIVTDEDTDLMVDEFIAAETRAWQEHLDATAAAAATVRPTASPSPKRSPTHVSLRRSSPLQHAHHSSTGMHHSQ